MLQLRKLASYNRWISDMKRLMFQVSGNPLIKDKKVRKLLKLVATVVELPMARTQLRKGSSPVKLGTKTVLTAKSCIISNLYAGQRRQSQILLLRNQHQLSHPPSLAT